MNTKLASQNNFMALFHQQNYLCSEKKSGGKKNTLEKKIPLLTKRIE